MPQKRLSPTAELMNAILAADGTYMLTLASTARAVSSFDHQLRAAVRFRLIPTGHRLFHKRHSQVRHELALVESHAADAWFRSQQTSHVRLREKATAECVAEQLRGQLGDALRERAAILAEREKVKNYVRTLKDRAVGLREHLSENEVDWLRWAETYAERPLPDGFFEMPNMDLDAAKQRALGERWKRPSDFYAARWFEVK